jgi:hypothetical protein
VPFHAEDYVHRIGRTGRAGASGLAVTLVTRDDTRQVGEIEKLIKKKIELEPLELEDDRPRRPPRRRDDEADAEAPLRPAYAAPAAHAAPAAAAGWGRRPPPAAPADPFFDRPYEPSGSEAPAWDAGAKPAQPAAVRGLSPNIRPKKKVASLLGGH